MPALTPDSRIGTYDIVSLLGAGGMGEVYRATDTILKRQVALKVLPPEVANDPARVARFQREAEVLASLNHPNIAHLYGAEQSNGALALVMELVEGETLADRIARGPIPLGEALPIAKQIAEALEAAHEQGIIHRDLKPANIKVRDDGTVKVLDFGLAKAMEPAVGGSVSAGALTNSPTITSPALMTGVGVLLGTAAYMSPEQARGQVVDKRSDIWAFGCVLFEMLTGRRPFEEATVADTLAAVMKTEPSWALLPPATPRNIRKLLFRALRKDRRKRLADSSDVLLELDDDPLPAADAPSPRPPWFGRAVAAVLAVVSGIVVLAQFLFREQPSSSSNTVRTIVGVPADATIGTSNNNVDVTISADGRRIAYMALRGGKEELHVQSLEELDPTVILTGGIRDIRGPSLSPDGRWVAFIDENHHQLKRVSTSGGPPIVIASTAVGASRGVAWLGPDTIVLATDDRTTGIMQVRVEGGSIETLTVPESGEDHIFPHPTPDRRGVLFTIASASTGVAVGNRIAVVDLQSKKVQTVVASGSGGRYLDTGHIVYADGSSLFVIPFNLQHLTVHGAAMPVVSEVASKGVGAAQFAVSATGTLLYVRGASTSTERALVWVDAQGREEPLGAPSRNYSHPRLSPDGTRVVMDVRDQRGDIWIWELGRRVLTQLTSTAGVDRAPVWSPDGARVAFTSDDKGRENVYWQKSDGTGQPERLTSGEGVQFAQCFTPDGRTLLFSDTNGRSSDLLTVNVVGAPHPVPLLHSDFNERNADISPDGRWLVYQSDESGSDEVYVRPYPLVDSARYKVSTAGGSRPMWSHDGKHIFYAANAVLVSVAVSGAAQGLHLEAPREVLQTRNYPPFVDGRTYDVSREGNRFLMLKAAEGQRNSNSRLVLVQNWFAELEQPVSP